MHLLCVAFSFIEIDQGLPIRPLLQVPKHISVDRENARIDGEGSDKRNAQPSIESGDTLISNNIASHCRYAKLGFGSIKWSALNACFYCVKGKGTAPDDTSSDASCEERWDKAMLIATRDLGYSMSD